MLTNLSLKNIKSFNEDATLQIAPITLIYGPNSAGKSSLWKFFLALKDSSGRNSSNSFLNLTRSDFANIKTLSFDRSKKSTFTINFSKSNKSNSTVFAYHFENPLPVYKDLELLNEEKQILDKLTSNEREKLIEGINKIIDKYKAQNSIPNKKPEKIEPETIDEALAQIRKEQEETTRLLADKYAKSVDRFKDIQNIDQGENPNNLKLDELEIIQADKSLMTFKIVELPKIKKTEGVFFARQASRREAAEHEKNIIDTISKHYKKYFTDQKFEFEVKVRARKELHNEFRDGPFSPDRIFDMVGPTGPKEIKTSIRDGIEKERFLFLPTKISKDKSLWVKYFDFLQFLKSKMRKNNKDKNDDREIFKGYINENFREEDMYLENQYGVDSFDIPEIHNTFEKTLNLMSADLEEFIEIITKDLETFIMSGKSFIPDQRFYGARILKIIFDEIADKFLDAHIGNIDENGDQLPLTEDDKKVIAEFEKLIPFSLVDQIRNLYTFNNQLTKFKKSNFNTPFPMGTTGANYGISKFLSSGIHEDEDYKNKIISFLDKIDLPFEIKSKLDANGNINLSFENKKITNSKNAVKEIPLEQSGNALKSILLLLADILRSKESVIILEEPENKLHPKIQGNLIELLSGLANQNKNQIIIETHSEHFLLRIQKLIRNKDLEPNQVAINYVYLDENGLGSKIDHMELDDKGKFKNKWRHGFFNERLNEI